jgi:tetratricopeptide (TPR) repeat protein
MNRLLALHYRRGEYEEASALARELLALTRKLYGAEHPAVINILSNLGVLRSRLGDNAEAEALLRESVDMARRLHQEDHPIHAQNLCSLGMTLDALHRSEEGSSSLREGLAVQRRLSGAADPTAIKILKVIAKLRLAAGDLDGAEGLYRESLSLISSRKVPMHRHGRKSDLSRRSSRRGGTAHPAARNASSTGTRSGRTEIAARRPRAGALLSGNSGPSRKSRSQPGTLILLPGAA